MKKETFNWQIGSTPNDLVFEWREVGCIEARGWRLISFWSIAMLKNQSWSGELGDVDNGTCWQTMFQDNYGSMVCRIFWGCEALGLEGSWEAKSKQGLNYNQFRSSMIETAVVFIYYVKKREFCWFVFSHDVYLSSFIVVSEVVLVFCTSIEWVPDQYYWLLSFNLHCFDCSPWLGLLSVFIGS